MSDGTGEAGNVSVSISVANNSEATVVSKGAVNLEAGIGGTSCKINLSNIVCVSQMQR